jgi:hypothetical protein
VPPLAEVQRLLRAAIVGQESSEVVPFLVGGAEPAGRLAIHTRHYEASLVRALLLKYPATAWLVGSTLMDQAAREFVHRHPPTAPCIAEYGEGFPRFLAEYDVARDLPYLRFFTELEWHIGHAAIAADGPAINLPALAAYEDQIADVAFVVQPSLRYLAGSWPVDELMRLYLSDTAPEQYRLSAAETRLEICGSRGAFRFDRLAPGEFSFRQALAQGSPLGVAAEQALEVDESLDIGAALRGFVTSGLVAEVRSP